jgi:hypothetical protein
VEGYSKVVLNAVKFTSTVGLSCGGDENSLLELFLVIGEEKKPKIDSLLQRLRRRESSKIWNALLILRLEAMALVGSMAGWCRFYIMSLGLLWVLWGIKFL